MKKIPKFKTDEAAAKFWESHSFQDDYGDTKEAAIKFVRRRAAGTPKYMEEKTANNKINPTGNSLCGSFNVLIAPAGIYLVILKIS